MLKNYFKIAWRNLLRNRVSSFINIGGLAIGMAVTIVISLWVWDEFSFNKNFKNYDSIAQVYTMELIEGNWRTMGTPAQPLAAELKTKYGDSFRHVVLSRYTQKTILTAGERVVTENGRFMSSEAPEMLTLKMVQGERTALKDPSSIILSQSAAAKLFGKEEAMNKMVSIDNELTAKVSGIYEDLPSNTEFGSMNFIAAWELLYKIHPWIKNSEHDWQNKSFLIYVQLASQASLDVVSSKIKNAVFDNLSQEERKSQCKVFLHPMSRWHLHDKWKNGVNTGGYIQIVRLIGVIGSFVLLLACINFMNLSTAKSEKRAKEVGVRKSVGSNKLQLVGQFLCEAFLVTLIAFALAICIVILTLPWFNQLADKQLTILWGSSFFWIGSLAFIVITSLLAGSYPAFYLSAFNPIDSLKGKLRLSSASFPRKVLVVTQFAISVTLIIGTIMVYKQIQFAKNRPIGYNSNGVIGIRMTSELLRWKVDFLCEKLKNERIAVQTARSNSPVTEIWDYYSGFEWPGKRANQTESFATFWVSHDFGKTIGWKMKEGRDFSRQLATDSTSDGSKPGLIHSVIVNEAAVEYMALKQPLNQVIRWDEASLRIIGVVKDQVMNSPFDLSSPTIYMVNYDNATNWIYLKLNPDLSANDAIARLQATFKQIVPTVPFDYSFVDDEFAVMFESEERMGKLSTLFASLAILISCLGLLGLTSFVAEQRKKEISIRKVLGASVFSLWKLLSSEFIILVAVSCLIAFPLAWSFLSNWLSDYQYRTELSWWVFLAAGSGAIMITLVTVSYQAVKAATANPVKNLRTE